MNKLRPLILCGCTGDAPTRCAHKSWAGGACKCPCHFTQEQTQRLISAYIHASDGQVAGFIKNMSAKTKESTTAYMITAACGHEKHLSQKPSQMASMYIKQHSCDDCEMRERGLCI